MKTRSHPIRDPETRRAYLRGYLVAVPMVTLAFAVLLSMFAMAMKRHGLI